ncbi:CBS domain-containing protein [Amycolatopsis rhizosphaerae]|uniref:CBS domain-containing protein n=1 Tax=Amycolatopsis rhizosphaerae TaxID=2053003 RepID=A0A558CCC0_9PSEU|nr:CBS domain-containing protein [Amycolatopsis rhizosphaerae]TVT46419.1 CBS domain-containing protein [Amycolatopsis rhizosphaerae]
MAQTVREIMTTPAVSMPPDASVKEAAQRMRDEGIGDVLVTEGEQLKGIVTDRDIVVRGLAERDDLSNLHLSDVCSSEIVTAEPNETADEVISRMRQRSVRRIPVVEKGKPVGILSLGDAAVEKDPHSALGDISAARGNT